MPDSPALSDFTVFNAPLACILLRLENAHQPGGLLEDMRAPASSNKRIGASVLWAPALIETFGNSDLPCVRYRGATTMETKSHLRGALAETPIQQTRKITALAVQRVFQFSVMTSYDNGILSKEGCSGPPGHEDYVARVLHVIESQIDGTPDGTLGGTCSVPIVLTVAPPDVDSENYIESIISVDCQLVPFLRGQRLDGIDPSLLHA